MPIANELQHYGDEGPFRKDFLIPLLHRLGYDVVCDYHGTREFGRDIVFQEIDGFGQPLYHGLQAKYEDSVSQSVAHKLLEQCHEAFTQPFEHKSTGARHFVAHLYIVNAGNISDNAERIIREAYKGRVSLIDGKTIVQVDRWGAIRDMEKREGILRGLASDLEYNWRIASEIQSDLDQFARGETTKFGVSFFRTTGLDNFLVRPIPSDRFQYEEVQQVWRACSEANAVKDILFNPTSEDRRRRLAGEIAAVLCAPILDNCQRLLSAVNATLEEIGKPLATALDIDVPVVQ
jgi:hypothetical protein